MLGTSRFGSIFGSMIGGVLLTMGWGFTAIISLLAVPAALAALAVLAPRRASEGEGTSSTANELARI